MKIGFPGRATSNICVIHAPFFLFHSITVNPAFECSEQNHHSDFLQFPPAVTEDCFKLYKEKTGLIFIHLRIFITKLSTLILIALKSRAAVQSVSETQIDDPVKGVQIYIENYGVLRSER
jgi:hypothetical protein